jgi:GTPase SAR1 family protein
MKIERNKLSDIPAFKQDIDNKNDLPYIPAKPLDKMCKSFFLYVIGSPGSGKTSTNQSLLTSHPTKSQPNKPKYFYKFWDNIFLISGSLQTLSNKFLKLLPDHKKHNEYSDNLLAGEKKVVGHDVAGFDVSWFRLVQNGDNEYIKTMFSNLNKPL